MAFWKGTLFYWFGVWAQTAPIPAGLSSMALSSRLESLSLPDWESHLLRAALLRGTPHVVYVQREELFLSSLLSLEQHRPSKLSLKGLKSKTQELPLILVIFLQ